MVRPFALVASLLAGGCLVLNPEYDPSQASGGGSGGLTGGTASAGGSATGSGDTPPGSGDSGTTGAAGCRSNADCDDALFCNGVESCEPAEAEADARGCVAGVAPRDNGMTCSESQGACLSTCDMAPDADGDGFEAVECGGLDCDDGDPGVFPDQQEDCDDVDDDCDPATLGSQDGDGDGKISSECCNPSGGGVLCGDDCDDGIPGFGLGDWAHCGGCGMSCGAQQACEAGSCVAARRVFLTSTEHTGQLGGLAGADGICQSRAEGAGLGGAFKAFIVDESKSFDRFEKPGVPFVRLDGVRIADDWGDLMDGSIAATLNVSEHRQTIDDNAWTGLTDDGNGSGLTNTCNNWTSDVSNCLQNGVCAGCGESNRTDIHWDGYYIFNCDEKFRLYCFEQ